MSGTTVDPNLPVSFGLYDPWLHAARLGLRVVMICVDPTDDERGWYVDDERTIYLDLSCHEGQIRATLAHEVEHALHRHRPLKTARAIRLREERVETAAVRRLMPDAEWNEALEATSHLEGVTRRNALVRRFRVDGGAVEHRLALPVLT